jgi:hypothetical protein
LLPRWWSGLLGGQLLVCLLVRLGLRLGDRAGQQQQGGKQRCNLHVSSNDGDMSPMTLRRFDQGLNDSDDFDV